MEKINVMGKEKKESIGDEVNDNDRDRGYWVIYYDDFGA